MGSDYSVLESFRGDIVRPRAGALYQLGLVLVALMMVLMVGVYLAWVGLVGYCVYYHAVHHWRPIMAMGGQVFSIHFLLFKGFLYFCPLFAGLIIFFFMVKPIFAGRPKIAPPMALNANDNPVLYAFIERICALVGAPSPQRIYLDCHVNASAGFRNGWRGLFSNNLVLTLGLPLVANLSAAELAGVVAHEFGHFTQGVGLRLSFLSNQINYWFLRVVYQRDAWDVALEQWANEENGLGALMLIWCAQLGVWFSRLILKLHMYAAVLISGFMSRQMEFDADACAYRLVGTEIFEATQRKTATLHVAGELAYKQIAGMWQRNHVLPDNIAELIRQAHEQIPEAVSQRLNDSLGLMRAGSFSTHPAPGRRIQRARQAAEPGVFHDARPASDLFARFEFPARFVTLQYYTDELGIPITEQMLQKVELKNRPAGTPVAVDASAQPGVQYFLGLLPILNPLELPPPQPPADLEAAAQELERLRAGLGAVAAQLAPVARDFAAESQREIRFRAARLLLEAGYPIKAPEFDLVTSTVAEARTAEAQARTRKTELAHSVHEVTTALRRRLDLALGIKLLDRGEYSDPIGETDLATLVTNLNTAAADYTCRQETLREIAVFDFLVAQKHALGETPPISRALAAQMRVLQPQLTPQPPSGPAVAATSGLHLSRRHSHANEKEVAGLRLQCEAWLQNYDEQIEQLALLAMSVERLDA